MNRNMSWYVQKGENALQGMRSTMVERWIQSKDTTIKIAQVV